MARAPRYDVAGAFHHVNVKGVDDRFLFVDDLDHVVFELRLEEVVTKHEWEVLAYCAMGTHVHLVLRTPKPNLGDGMRDLFSAYCLGFNRRHGRRGHLLLERYYDRVIGTEEHLRRAVRYAVLNPVKAGLVRWSGDWEWSSYRATAGLRTAPSYLAINRVLALFGRQRKDAYENFERYVAAEIDELAA
jgi:putative transposase